MATINPVLVNEGAQNNNGKLYKWSGMTSDDTATPLVVASVRDLNIGVVGDFGGDGVVTIQGSVQPEVAEGSRTYVNLERANNQTVQFTSAGVQEVLTLPILIKPVVTLGTAESLDVYARVTF